ncbi:hypothetical protein SKAU_G00277380 [Synaphobranchus kaupii]|uniref:Uncharacterized protein n=1 Tax=Synaphobranchus kaupii TaxID=118154 RepID=A0A9Q1F1E0_SYNKA|nr:hypothetical protein SKAU_G00277380 [Synaphobranchus kaupii]
MAERSADAPHHSCVSQQRNATPTSAETELRAHKGPRVTVSALKPTAGHRAVACRGSPPRKPVCTKVKPGTSQKVPARCWRAVWAGRRTGGHSGRRVMNNMRGGQTVFCPDNCGH